MFNTRHDPRLKDRAARLLIQRAGLSLDNVALCGALLGVSDGTHVIDMGCGAGIGTQALAQLVGASGHVVGIEPNESLLAKAAGLLGLPQLRWKGALGESTGETTATFDVCWIDRVLAHCTEPALVVAEAARVLRPGGRLFSCEIDYSMIDLSESAPALDQALRGYRVAVASPGVARSLPGLLRTAFPGATLHRQSVMMSLGTRRELWGGLALGLWLRSRAESGSVPIATLRAARRELSELARAGSFSAQVPVQWTLVWTSRRD